ncbi:hypothetical protein [uncultured Porphyromonas sp.]|uniref:hypothetical protein n=1 Tax=uncultured Porphyromonas sp. TaxID=159274 RepID=UPI002615F179|nr:hypothetical protein [uncultured Porphyromonas sp.]
MVQSIITYLIVAVVAILIGRHLWRIVKPRKREVPAGCAGCPLADSCQKHKIKGKEDGK